MSEPRPPEPDAVPQPEQPQPEQPEAEQPEAEQPEAEQPVAEQPVAEQPEGAAPEEPAAAPEQPEAAAPDQPTRRRLLDMLLGASLLGWAGAVLYPVLRYLTPLGRGGQAGPTRLDGSQLAELDKDSYVIVRAGGQRVLVLEHDKQVLAFSAVCTHEGCLVRYLPKRDTIWCACHNGRYDLTGRVIAGPPPRPLPRYQAHRDAKGVVVSTQESA